MVYERDHYYGTEILLKRNAHAKPNLCFAGEWIGLNPPQSMIIIRNTMSQIHVHSYVTRHIYPKRRSTNNPTTSPPPLPPSSYSRPPPNPHPQRRLLINQINLLIIPLPHIPPLPTQLDIKTPNHLCENQFHFRPREPVRHQYVWIYYPEEK